MSAVTTKNDMKDYVGKVLSGKEFKKIFPTYQAYKVVGNNANSMQYHIGLNENTEPFNPTGSCSSGGIYFTNYDAVWNYFGQYGHNVAFIEILDDNQIYIENEKCKADKIMITNIITLHDWIALWMTYENSLGYIKRNEYLLYIALTNIQFSLNDKLDKDEINKFYLEAIQHYVSSIYFVKEEFLTYELCMAAVQKFGVALYCINNIKKEFVTPELCLEAVKQEPLVICLLKDPSYEICLEAVKKWAFALEYIKEEHQTPELLMEAVKQNPMIIKYIKNQTPELCLLAVKKGYVMEHVKEECQTLEICLEAVKYNSCSIKYVINQTPEVCLKAVRIDPRSLFYIKDQTIDLCLEAITVSGDIYPLKLMRNQTPELCLAVVKLRGCALQLVKEQTHEICLAAVKQNRYAWNYVKDEFKTFQMYMAWLTLLFY